MESLRKLNRFVDLVALPIACRVIAAPIRVAFRLVVERKKYGKAKARRSFQFSKR
jgi:hypothetical protein